MRHLIMLLLLSTSIGAQQSFSLEEAIDYAIQHSQQVRMAELDVKDAAAQITEFKAIGIPQVNGTVNYQYYIEVPVNPVEDFITPSVYRVLENEGVPGVDPYVGPPEIFEFSFFQRNNLNVGIEGSWLLFDGSYLSGLKAAKLFKDLTQKGMDVTEEKIRADVT